MVIQTTSPLVPRKSFWCIVDTLSSVGFTVHPYQTTVPSFGIWGYALAKLEPFDPPRLPRTGVELHFLNDDSMASMFEFPEDESRPAEALEINRLDNQALVRYYEAEWKRFEQ